MPESNPSYRQRPASASRLLIACLIAAFTPGVLTSVALAQSAPEAGREFRRTGVHDGNLVFTRYSNFGNLGSRFEPPKMEWPKGSGQWYGFEFIMMAGSEVRDASGQFTRIVSENYTNPGSFDISPDGTHTYGWEPLGGYFNTGASNRLNYPAMSHLEETWPDSWPVDYPGVPGSRDGRWNGEFGAFLRADQESYYQMDDRNNDEFDYYPFIGSSVDSSDYPDGRRGLGLQVAVRGYQWVNVQAEDILIVRYDIENVSDKELTKVVFGMYVDPAVGGQGDSVDDFADFQRQDDIVYMWDRDGLDNQGRPGVGYFGFAFLESPGEPLDGEDNDQNGIADELQDNPAGMRIEGQEAIAQYVMSNYNMVDFENFFGALETRPAYQAGVLWTGDEDVDWVGFIDDNGNGVRDPGELLLDDKGSDGIGPEDEGYPGPDGDGTEGNGMPDFGEPNFGKTDNDESDQIGLTSFVLRPAGNVSDDERTWLEMEPNRFGGEMPSNLAFIYGSGYFSLPRMETRKFAVANLFGRDLDDILRNKRTMQRIYDADYSFAKPPNRPVLTAVPGNGRAVLMWDNRAEFSRDPIYGQDFEGYKIYRSTDPSFNSIKTITDAFGNPILWEPVAQFDIKNGLHGAHPVQVGETGAVYDMGTDTGLRYFYVDEGLDNGRRYFYAVAAYDTGYDLDFFQRGLSTSNRLTPIAPSETAKIIQTDLVGNVTFVDQNTAVVVPNAPAAGAVTGGVDGELMHSGPATGRIDIDVVVPDSLGDGAEYMITFTDTTKALLTRGIRIEDLSSGDVVYEADPFDSLALSTRLIDGMNFHVYTPPEPAPVVHGWSEGESNLSAVVDLVVSERSIALPEDVEIRIGPPGVDSSFTQFPFEPKTPVNFEIFGTTTGRKYDFIIDETGTPDERLSDGDVIVMVFDQVGFRFNLGWQFAFSSPENEAPVLPEEGDVFELMVSKPYSSRDIVSFTTSTTSFNPELARNELDDIYVVPDPYVVSASW
ncbi:MAG: hypothetical protein HKN17_09000, partial [Rhodothermales bacterium]|nr:hypothetical protein [Rhodothermales bacterium]